MKFSDSAIKKVQIGKILLMLNTFIGIDGLAKGGKVLSLKVIFDQGEKPDNQK